MPAVALPSLWVASTKPGPHSLADKAGSLRAVTLAPRDREPDGDVAARTVSGTAVKTPLRSRPSTTTSRPVLKRSGTEPL